MAQDNRVSESRVSRRKILLGLGGATATSLAGCSTEAPSTTTTTTTTSGSGGQDTSTKAGSEPIEAAFHVSRTTVNPHTADMPPQGDVATWDPLVKMQMMTYGRNARNPNLEYKPLIVESEEFIDNKIWKIHVADGYKWHNGKKVTAEDRYWKEIYSQESAKAEGNQPPWKDVRLSSDKMTLELELHEEQAKSLFIQSNRPYLRSARWRWKKWAEKMTDATTSKEAAKINKELKQAKHPLKDWVGNGIYKVDEIADNRVTFTKWEDHPHADKQNIEKVVVPVANDSQLRLMIKNNETDWLTALPKGAEQLRPDGFTEHTKPALGGGMFIFNWMNNKHLARRPVRRAIAYLLDSKNVMQTVGNSYPVQRVTGQTDRQGRSWIDDYDTVKEKYIDYGSTARPKAAAEELKKAGYTKNSDGHWVDSEGDAISLTIESVSWWKEQHKTYADQLRREGIQAEVRVPPNFDSYWAQPESDWDILTWFHGRFVNHPHSTYSNGFLAMPTVQKQVKDGETKLEQYGARPRHVTIPKNIGDKEVTGSGQELDLYKMQQELSAPETSESRLKELDKTFSWYWNYTVPSVMFYWSKAVWNGDTKHFNFPHIRNKSQPDAWGRRDLSYGLNTGTLTAKTK